MEKCKKTIYSFIEENRALLSSQYECDNYSVSTTGIINKKAILFCSGNGIYFPNEEIEFKKRIIEEDYYDWKNIARHRKIRRKYEKIVFIRDIYKQWYVNGINSKLNNIGELLNYLTEMLQGYELTVCGSSAGGYMALLCGSELNAKRIFVNSPQVNLHLLNDAGPYIDSDKNNEFFNLYSYIEKGNTTIFYFYPNGSIKDIEQFEAVKHLNINFFSINSNEHGKTLNTLCYPYLFSADEKILNEIVEKYRDKNIGTNIIYRDIVPIWNRFWDPLFYVLKRKIGYWVQRV